MYSIDEHSFILYIAGGISVNYILKVIKNIDYECKHSYKIFSEYRDVHNYHLYPSKINMNNVSHVNLKKLNPTFFSCNLLRSHIINKETNDVFEILPYFIKILNY